MQIGTANIPANSTRPSPSQPAVPAGQGVNAGQQPPVQPDAALSNPRKMLNDQIIASLQQALGGQAPSLYELDPEDYSPAKVADRILNFVGQALARLDGDTQALYDRMQAARQGVEIGFNEARDILTGLGAYNGQVQDNAEQTYALIQQGLSNFDQSIANGEPIQQAVVSQSASVAQSQRISLQVNTRDGDVVTLHISRDQGASMSDSLNQAGLQVSERSSFASSGLSYQVEGNLDDSERSAIDQLLGQIQQVSNKFFTGDTQAAIATASGLGYDTAQLAGFSLSLSESSQSRATTTYQTVGHLGDLAKPLLAKPSAPFGQFVRDFAQALGDMERSPLFGAKADESFAQLFSGLPRMNESQQAMITQLEQLSGQSLEQVTTGLIQALKPYANSSHNNAA